mmetsp:Transcript_18072/g.54478  ORF Transcript_18072/g.54478 Transcript_18072/m.54478 type:complete len:86 (+) Transcript_18072:463-720(+)
MRLTASPTGALGASNMRQAIPTSHETDLFKWVVQIHSSRREKGCYQSLQMTGCASPPPYYARWQFLQYVCCLIAGILTACNALRG